MVLLGILEKFLPDDIKQTLSNLPINLFKGLKRGFGTNDDQYSITFDLLIDESYTMSNTVTKHPVQDGSVITDHIQNMLRSGAMTGLVSNFSLKSIFVDKNRAQDAYDTLVALWKNRDLVTITVGLEVFDDWIITDISTSRSAKDGESLTFKIAFMEARIVSLQQVDVGVQVKFGAGKDAGDNQAEDFAENLYLEEIVPNSNYKQGDADLATGDVELSTEDIFEIEDVLDQRDPGDDIYPVPKPPIVESDPWYSKTLKFLFPG